MIQVLRALPVTPKIPRTPVPRAVTHTRSPTAQQPVQAVPLPTQQPCARDRPSPSSALFWHLLHVHAARRVPSRQKCPVVLRLRALTNGLHWVLPSS